MPRSCGRIRFCYVRRSWPREISRIHPNLNQYLLDHTCGFDTGQLEVKSLRFVGEPRVINPQTVQHRGVQIMRGHGVFSDILREVIGLSVGNAAFDSPTGKPHGEAARMVIMSVLSLRELPLAKDRAAELTAPDDERFIQQAALA
jgi:hypothetical protein